MVVEVSVWQGQRGSWGGAEGFSGMGPEQSVGWG